jgi:hypothetical protein
MALQLAKNVFKAGTIATTADKQKEQILLRLGAGTYYMLQKYIIFCIHIHMIIYI